MNRSNAHHRKRKGLFPQQFGYMSRDHVGLFQVVVYGRSGRLRLIVRLDQLLRFVNINLSLNMFAGRIYQIFRGLQTIDGLKSDCRSPGIGFLPAVRFVLSDIFFKISHGALLKNPTVNS